MGSYREDKEDILFIYGQLVVVRVLGSRIRFSSPCPVGLIGDLPVVGEIPANICV